MAIAPSYMVDHDVAANRLIEVWVSPEPPREQVFISWSQEHVRQPDVRRIVDWIAAEFESEPTFKDEF